jgi:hypothetical protein
MHHRRPVVARLIAGAICYMNQKMLAGADEALGRCLRCSLSLTSAARYRTDAEQGACGSACVPCGYARAAAAVAAGAETRQHSGGGDSLLPAVPFERREFSMHMAGATRHRATAVSGCTGVLSLAVHRVRGEVARVRRGFWSLAPADAPGLGPFVGGPASRRPLPLRVRFLLL